MLWDVDKRICSRAPEALKIPPSASKVTETLEAVPVVVYSLYLPAFPEIRVMSRLYSPYEFSSCLSIRGIPRKISDTINLRMDFPVGAGERTSE